MTICAAWIRRVGKSQELVFCSDSRLRSFGAWDANPKIFTFSRTDCAICFAGDTKFSYPLVIQLTNVIGANPKIESRFQRLDVFKEIIVKTLNQVISHKSDYEVPDVEFLFGGYCWFSQKFKIWKIRYDASNKIFLSQLLNNGEWKKGELAAYFIGDYLPEVKSNLIDLLKKKGVIADHRLDMEPLEVLTAMLSSPSQEKTHYAIGGPPQLLKVYKSLNRVPFGVTWTIKNSSRTTFFGMPVHSLSGFGYPIIDPHTLLISNSNKFK